MLAAAVEEIRGLGRECDLASAHSSGHLAAGPYHPTRPDPKEGLYSPAINPEKRRLCPTPLGRDRNHLAGFDLKLDIAQDCLRAADVAERRC